MQMNSSQKNKLLLFIALVIITGVCFLNPISQSQEYHNFSDDRIFFFFSNFFNVISNLPFVISGMVGLYFTVIKNKLNTNPVYKSYIVFFIGILFTGFGSAYYHLNPNDNTLIWDRLPMTISFMSFFSLIIGECVSAKLSKQVLFPFLLIGFSSIIYWQITANYGHDDLRFYILIQFLPIVLIPIILLLYKPQKDLQLYLWLIILSYLIAKIGEAFDNSIYQKLQIISGHTIKHLFASFAPVLLIFSLYKRKDFTIN